MRTPLLEILREIPDHRRVEGRRFDLSMVLLYSIIAMVGGANSYRQMREFIRIHRQSLNAAFGLELRYAPSYTGLRLILHGVDPDALESAFRRHASTLAEPPDDRGASGNCGGRQDLGGSFDAFCDRKAAHMMTALHHADQIVLAHVMVAERSNECQVDAFGEITELRAQALTFI